MQPWAPYRSCRQRAAVPICGAYLVIQLGRLAVPAVKGVKEPHLGLTRLRATASNPPRGQSPHTTHRTDAIDWGAAAIGPIGADLAELALSRSIGGDLLAPGGEDLGERLYRHYTAGLLTAVGASEPDVAAARDGYALTAALAGTSRLHWTLERILDETRRLPQPAARWSDSDDVLRRWAALTRLFLSLIE